MALKHTFFSQRDVFFKTVFLNIDTGKEYISFEICLQINDFSSNVQVFLREHNEWKVC